MPQPTPDPLNSLSERERDLVSLVAEGYPNKQIAARLGITHSTVRTHLLHIYKKLGIHSRTEAAAIHFRAAANQISQPKRNRQN